MFRKISVFLFIAVVYILTSQVSFALVSCSQNPFVFDTAAGECDYSKYGMKCGGNTSLGACSSGQRCVFDPIKTSVNPDCGDGRSLYVGKCLADNVATAQGYPTCGDSCNIPNDSGDCGSTPCAPCNTARPGERCTGLARLGTLGGVAACYIQGDPNCRILTPVSGAAFTTGYWKEDASCAEEVLECTGNDSCDAGETCVKVGQFQDGTLVGYRNECTSQTGCSLPDGYILTCSTATGCALNEYCTSTFNFFNIRNGTACIDTDPGVPYPGVCFSDEGDICGKTVSNPSPPKEVPPTLFPLIQTCTEGNACLDTSSYIPAWPLSSYPSTGVCANCVQGTEACTGNLIPGGNGLDDCCDPNKKCSLNGVCQTLDNFTTCTRDPSLLAAGSVCKYYGGAIDRCSSCPIEVNGQKSYLDTTTGNRKCYATTDSGAKCTDDCGCATGNVCNTSTGTCVAQGSCIPNGGSCNLSAPNTCCSQPDFSCRDSILAPLSPSCQSDESIQCLQIKSGSLACTQETASCCPSDKPYCMAGACVANFECSEASEGECCPGYGQICQSGQCVPTTDGKCTVEGEPLPPAPGYLGHQIEIPQLFSALGAILYPAGIGIGLFFVVKAGYELMMSEGNPDAVKSAQETLTAAIIGIVFIILSASILRVIINSLLG